MHKDNTQMLRTVEDDVCEQLKQLGVKYVFGNPGTTECGLLERIIGGEYGLEFVMALHEGTVTGAADVYARMTGVLGVALVHSIVGLGNSMGAIAHAKKGKSPLLVLVGEAGLSSPIEYSYLGGDIRSLSAACTKGGYRVTSAEHAPRIIARAAAKALAHPRGPVVVGLPADLLAQESAGANAVKLPPVTLAEAPYETIENAIDLIKVAQNPLILVGNDVYEVRGVDSLVSFAEVIGANVIGTGWFGQCFPENHELFLGHTTLLSNEWMQHFEDVDLIIACGCKDISRVYPSSEPPWKSSIPVVGIALDSLALPDNAQINVALLGDIGKTFAKLTMVCKCNRHIAKQICDTDIDVSSGSVFHSFVSALADELPNVGLPIIVYDEAQSNSGGLSQIAELNGQRNFFRAFGGIAGSAIPASVGMSFANPGNRVVSFSGDGGAAYEIQGLWTLAHYKCNAVVIVVNNRKYESLALNFQHLKGRNVSHELDKVLRLSSPEIKFTEVAEAMGIESVLLTSDSTEDQILEASMKVAHSKLPLLLEIQIDWPN